jgi:hypothetical protein
MWESKMANSEDGKLELLTHKNQHFDFGGPSAFDF